ncbi:primosomal protein N' [Candidatus Peregrinibacteria bacterium]|nr:primosomal protein N' [Candidatus Peregrinibacteria bacterium]
MNNYAEVCLKRRMPKNLEILNYQIPSNLKDLKEGSLVKIPLRNSYIEGVVMHKTGVKPNHPVKDIREILFNHPVLSAWQIKLAKWISLYYKAPIQKAVNLFLPPKFYKFEYEPVLTKEILKEKHILTEEQNKAYQKILKTNKISLLKGITGSGKTEIYLHLAEKFIKEGKQCILIVPEISLTPQMVEYFERIFGKNVAILHSRLTEKQKSMEWMKIFLNDTPVIIGPRSAIFAPVKNPGLIILDEEHEFTYKQEQTPRYNTVDVIKKIFEFTGVKVVLGSATPSIASYYDALKNNFELVELNQRIGGAMLPAVTLVDLRNEFEKKNYSILSELLQEKIKSTLNSGKQAILFLNKRGSASAVVCRECGYMEKCLSCDMPMTYHKIMPESGIKKPSLICHHCGKITAPPLKCPVCGGLNIKYVGAGTQKVEEEIIKIFPKAKVARADRDTMSKRGSFEKIYEKLIKKEIDILIGTQMIGKGLHLPNVNLVGVILADIGLHFPDFRSSERTFQLLTQVAGRAGRTDIPGEVIIQTYMTENIAISLAKTHDYDSFYKYEIEQRKSFNYPPISKLIKLTFVDPNPKKALLQAQKINNILKEIAPHTYRITLYPALIFKMNNKYRWNILIQGHAPEEVIQNVEIPENCRVDVDPISIG